MTLSNSSPKDIFVDATVDSINKACRSRGGIYSKYSCKFISWDDSSRTSGPEGSLSCLGNNITDTYLKAKDGRKLFTVRPDNWNEKLGTVTASGLAVVVGNHRPQGLGHLQPITLRDLLKNMGEYGEYAGLNKNCDLSNDQLDCEVSIRFQTTFLPISSKTSFFGGNEKETMEFATEAYNYQTHRDNDPKNIILLCTTQGLAVQQDGSKNTRLYHHSVDNSHIHRHWLEAEGTAHRVGKEQKESQEEKEDALARGKATATVIGPRALGTRFNCLMTVQIPLKQKGPPYFMSGGGGFGFADSVGGTPFDLPQGGAPWVGGAPAFGAAAAPVPASLFSATPPAAPTTSLFGATTPTAAPTTSLFGTAPVATTSIFDTSERRGMSSAARVSRGTEQDVYLRGTLLKAKSVVRHESERITVTVVLYNIVVGGVPTEADVTAAIDDLEQLYAACSSVSRKDTHQFNDGTIDTKTSPSVVINGGIFPEPKPPKAAFSTKKFSPFSDVLTKTLLTVSNLPMNMETYTYLHDMGIVRLNDPTADREKLFDAFGYFRLTNDISIQQKGAADGTSLYNMACCCSRLASHSPVQPGTSIVPAWTISPNSCLNASVSWLIGAVGAGYKNHAHMMVDQDLEEVRQHRSTQFSKVISYAQSESI